MSTVAVINGSLRRDSIHRKLVESLAKLAGDRMTFHFVEIGDLPLYNDDLWPEPPTSVLRMKREVELADAVLFASPEYNRSFSPALKNAIDWGTRPYGKNSWRAKPATVVSASPGAIGGAAGQQSLRALLTVVDTVLMGQPEIYFSYKAEAFDADGNVVDEKVKAFFETFIDRFATWIERTKEPVVDAQPDAQKID